MANFFEGRGQGLSRKGQRQKKTMAKFLKKTFQKKDLKGEIGGSPQNLKLSTKTHHGWGF